MNPFDPEEHTEPVPQLPPLELAAEEIRLRPWPVRLGPLAFDRLRDMDEQRRRLDAEWARLDEAREQARAEGFRQGQAEARMQSIQRLQELLARHDDVLGRQKKDLILKLPKLIARLATRTLGQELSSSPEVLSSWVLRLLGECLPAESVTLLHHRSDAGRFAELTVRAAAAFQNLRLQLREDDRIAPGEFILETPGLRVDARGCALTANWERELEQVLHEPEPG